MKKYAVWLLAGLMITMNFIWAYAQDTGPVVARDKALFNLKASAISVSDKLPYVTGSAFNVNRHIHVLIEAQIAEAAKAGPGSIEIMFETKSSGDIYSILIYYGFNGSGVYEKVDAVVFDNGASPKALVGVADERILGPNAVKLANRVISRAAAESPGRYNTDFSGVSEASHFYIDGDTVGFVFDKYEIGPGSAGIQKIAVDKKKITNFQISEGEYHFGGNYMVRMAPLRAVCEAFGYRVAWFPRGTGLKNDMVVITRGKSRYSLRININEYAVNDYTTRTLEAAPELYNGMACVPVSYMEEVLNLCLNVDSSGAITFSEYEFQ